MPEYYKHKESGDIYKLLHVANQGLVVTDYANKIYVLESEQNDVCTLQEQNFEKLMERCNPPVDWQSLYNTKVVCFMDSLGYSEEAFRLIGKASFNKDYLDRYEEIKNKVLPYTLKRLERYS